MEEFKSKEPIAPELREEAIEKILAANPQIDHHTQIHMADQMRRNGRWGTCSGCPRKEANDIEELTYGHGKARIRFFPEQCGNTNNIDHWLGVDSLDEK